MSLRCPGFLRRQWRIFEARRSLLRGLPEVTLDCLRDPCLALSPAADELRQRAVDVLCREAARKAAQGREGSVARILRTVSCEDPERAEQWRARFGPVVIPEAAAVVRPSPSPSFAGGIRTAVSNLLSEMRKPGASGGPRHPEGEPGAAHSGRPLRGPEGDGEPGASAATGDGGGGANGDGPRRFHLAVDDGGEFLVATGSELVFGHSRAARADLLFLADLESQHARLIRAESFHGGPSWSIEPISRGSVLINGRNLELERSTLFDGDEVQLASNLRFLFRVPEHSSSSAIIELLHGAECEGAMRILLLSPGEAGRVRIGSARSRHIPVADLEHEVVLILEGAWLRVCCAGGVKVLGSGAQDYRAECSLPCPPADRVDVAIAARPGNRPPFGLSLRTVAGAQRPQTGAQRPQTGAQQRSRTGTSPPPDGAGGGKP